MGRSNRKAEPAANPENPDPPVDSPPVQVIARTHLGEEIGGTIKRFAPGQRFTLPEARAIALGPLVEILSPEAPAKAE